MTKDAPSLIHKVRVDQLIQADKELFTATAQEFQMSNRRLTDSPSPMEEAMKVLCTDPRIYACSPLAQVSRCCVDQRES